MNDIKQVLLALTLAVNAQVQAQVNLDSLYSIWQDENLPDSTRGDAFDTYIWDGFLFSDPDSAYKLAERLVEFSTDGYPEGQANGLNIQGVSNAIRGDLSNALGSYRSALDIFEELGDQRSIANTLSNMGIAHRQLGDYSTALAQFTRSLEISEQTGDLLRLTNVLNNIGNLYSDQGNYTRALSNYQRGLAIAEERMDQKNINGFLTNIGTIYDELGDDQQALVYYQRSLAAAESADDQRGIAKALHNLATIYGALGRNTEALDNYQRVLSIYRSNGDSIGIAKTLNNAGIIYESQGRYPEALDHYQRALDLFAQTGYQRGEALVLGDMGNMLAERGDLREAEGHCKRGLVLAENMGLLEQQKVACQCLYKTYKAVGKSKTALEYYESMTALDDSLNATETAKKLQRFEFDKELLADSLRQEEEKHAIELAHQEEVAEKDKTRNMLMGGGLLLLLVAGGLFSRNRYVNQSRKAIQEEKDRSEELLLNILPKEVAEELKDKGKAEAQLIDQVTVLFTDFKGFTALSEQLSPKELVDDLNTCFSEFDRITAKYNIEKIKTIGDAYMAAGGLPTPNTTHAIDVIKAALEMRDFVEAGKAKKIAAGLPFFEIRIGVHTGPVVAGIVGVKKFQYDIWGDTVNTASRMESSGEVGQVNISEATYELVKENSEFEFAARGKVAAKGKGEMEMYFIKKA